MPIGGRCLDESANIVAIQRDKNAAVDPAKSGVVGTVVICGVPSVSHLHGSADRGYVDGDP